MQYSKYWNCLLSNLVGQVSRSSNILWHFSLDATEHGLLWVHWDDAIAAQASSTTAMTFTQEV
jgi:hypothetical protein